METINPTSVPIRSYASHKTRAVCNPGHVNLYGPTLSTSDSSDLTTPKLSRLASSENSDLHQDQDFLEELKITKGWTVFKAENGRDYRFNMLTLESSWIVPSFPMKTEDEPKPPDLPPPGCQDVLQSLWSNEKTAATLDRALDAFRDFEVPSTCAKDDTIPFASKRPKLTIAETA